MAKRDYYDVLGVSRDVDAAAMKKAYRKLAVQFHPDKNPDDEAAAEKFQELGEAYEVLSNEDKRAAYDRYGHAAFGQGGPGAGGAGGGFGGAGGDPFDIFREVFRQQGAGGGGAGGSIFDDFFGGSGGGGGGRARSNKRKGSDMRYDLEISLEEVNKGVQKELELERYVPCDTCSATGANGGKAEARACGTCGGVGQVVTQRGFFQVQQTCPTCGGAGESISNPCDKCDGEGRVQSTSRIKIGIPAGIDEGQRLRSTGNGDAGVRGGPAGDLYVFIHLKKHEIFERDDVDLFCEIPIPFTTVALGGEISVPTLEGKSSIKIPPGTQTDTSFRLRAKGLPYLNAQTKKGDLLVNVQVEVPVKLKREQIEQLQSFQETLGEANSPIGESFFAKAKRFFS